MFSDLVKGFSSLAQAVSFKNDSIRIDNGIDSCHKVVSIFLGISFIIVTASRYAVDPIRCSPGVVLPTTAWPVSMIENYCYMGKTYVVAYQQNKINNYDRKIKSNGGFSHIGRWLNKKSQKNKKIYMTHYYWLQYIILLQAFSFTLPKLFWEKFENGKLKKFTSLLSSYNETGEKKKLDDEEENYGGQEKDGTQEKEGQEIDFQLLALKDYWKKNFGKQNSYYFLYFISELLYLINVAAQYYFVDLLLNHMVYKDSWTVIKDAFDVGNTDLHSSFDFTFPVETLCELPIYDLTSHPVTSALTCVLTLNYLYRKIVFISWLLFIVLGILTWFNIFALILIVLTPRAIKNKILQMHYDIEKDDDIDVEFFFDQDFRVGDWFFLFKLKSNMDPVMMVQFKAFIFKNILGNHSLF